MPSVGGSINHILVWMNAGIRVIAPRVTASLLLLNVHVCSADTKHERHFNITSVNNW